MKALVSIPETSRRFFSERSARSRSLLLPWLFVWLFFSGFFGPSPPAWASNDAEIAYRRLYFGLQLPTDRDAERRVELIIELLKSGRVSEAAPLVEACFTAEHDHFSSEGRSLRSVIVGALGSLEPVSRSRLQSVLRSSFKKRLDTTKTPTEWRRLVAQSPSVVYGPAALAGLARVEEDTGAYRAAARAYNMAAEAARQASDERLAARLTERAAWNRQRLVPRDEADKSDLGSPRDDQAPKNWCGAGGDARRLGVASSQLPRRWRDWQAKLATSRNQEDGRGDLPTSLACGSTVAAGGVLVTRTVDGLTAIRADSGRRVWRRAIPISHETHWSAPQRGLSCDGKRVYAVAGNPSSALVAYDLAREGKIVWRLDAESLGATNAEAWFMGPPAADENRLYTLFESGQTISLVVIDAQTGKVSWRQPLTGIPNGRGTQDAVTPISPTVGDRLVYCPTGAGVVVAVDPLRRHLAWAHYLSVAESEIKRARSRGLRGGRRNWGSENSAWRHVRAVEADGLLTVVSPVATIVETLDASTGESLWSRSHSQGTLLAGVTDNLVVLVQREKVIARRRSDGKQVWSAALPAGDTVSGEGLLLRDWYVVPLASGRLAVVDLSPESRDTACGVIAFDLNPLESPPVLGDLLAYRGALYSRSDRLLQRLRPGGEPHNVLDRAIVALERGDSIEARGLLEGARQTGPTDLAIAEALAAADFVASGPGQEVSSRLTALGRVTGRRTAAYTALVRLSNALQQGDTGLATRIVEQLEKADNGSTTMTPDPGWLVSAARLARGRLALARGRDDSPAAASPSKATHLGPSADTAWSHRQIASRVVREDLQSTQLQSQRRRNRPSGESRLTAPNRPSRGEPTHWRFETHHGVVNLLGLDRWGDPAFAQPLPGKYRAPARRPKVVGGAKPRLLGWGDWVALPIERASVVFHVPSNSVAWTTESEDRENLEVAVAMGPWGVITTSPQLLRCRRLSDREVVWSRDIVSRRSLYPRVIAVADELFIATERREGVQLSAWSGERINDWMPPRSLDWGDQAGLNLYTIEQRSGPDGYGLRDLLVVPIERAQEPLLRIEVEPGTLLAAVEGNPNVVAMLTEEQRLTVVDVRAGEVRFSRELEGDSESFADSLRVRHRDGNLLVEVGQTRRAGQNAKQLSPVGGNPLLLGELHCLNAQTGSAVWDHPAEVSALSLLSPQADCPLLLLARRSAPPPGSSRGEAILSLVALDPATGATVYRNHDLPAGDESRGERPVRVQRESGDRDQIHVRMGRAVVSLSPAGPPAPPRPPHLARVEDPLGDQRENAKSAGWLRSLFSEE